MIEAAITALHSTMSISLTLVTMCSLFSDLTLQPTVARTQRSLFVHQMDYSKIPSTTTQSLKIAPLVRPPTGTKLYVSK